MKIHSHALVPAALGDKTQYISRHANDSTVRFGLVYLGRLSPARMRQAVKELVGRLEILHSSFAAREDRLGWSVNLDWTADQAFCCRKAENLQQELEQVMAEPLSPSGPVQLHCTLLEGEKECALAVRVGHMCADGGDARYLLYKLLELYSCLEAGRDAAAVELKEGRRDYDQCLGHLSPAQRLGLYRMPERGVATVFSFPDGEPGRPRMIWTALPAALLGQARAKAEHKATVNDLLLTAFYRALAARERLSAGAPVGIQCMMDLRRYMPGGDSLGVCNLSGLLPTSLPQGVQGAFGDTLAQVCARMAAAKEDPQAGMGELAVFSALLALLPFRAAEKLSTMFMGNGSVSLTNLGRISSQKLAAGALEPRRVLFGGPCKHKPSLQLAAVGTEDEVCLCATLCCTDADARAVEQLLAEMRRQLEAYATESSPRHAR